MRLTQIQQILEIEKSTSISQAARNLYISQPALSALLNEFELEIGVQLFTRTKLGVEPTENGSYILDSMKRIMNEIDYIQNFTSEAKSLNGNFSLMVGSSYEFLYTELIQRFKLRFPKAHLIPHNIFSSKVADKISKGILDMAILAHYNSNGEMLPLSTLESYKNLKIIPLKNCHTLAVMNAKHPLSQEEIIPLSKLIPEPLIFGHQFEMESFWELLGLETYPITNIDRLTVHQLLAQNSGIFLDATPLSLELYRTIHPQYCAIPVINDCTDRVPDILLNWPIYFVTRRSHNTRLQKLFIEDVYQILQSYQLIKEDVLTEETLTT